LSSLPAVLVCTSCLPLDSIGFWSQSSRIPNPLPPSCRPQRSRRILTGGGQSPLPQWNFCAACHNARRGDCPRRPANRRRQRLPDRQSRLSRRERPSLGRSLPHEVMERFRGTVVIVRSRAACFIQTTPDPRADTTLSPAVRRTAPGRFFAAMLCFLRLELGDAECRLPACTREPR
jgi:hypothetical protein